jgi:uncharacterized protein
MAHLRFGRRGCARSHRPEHSLLYSARFASDILRGPHGTFPAASRANPMRLLSPTLPRALLPLLAAALAACSPPVPRERDLLIATATTGGTYYPVGVAMATLITTELGTTDQVLCSAITSSGSAENIAMLQNGEVQLALLQGIFASMAWQGSGVYEGRPVPSLRGIAMLWPNVEQLLVLRRFVRSGTVDDIAGMSGQVLSLGPRSSGSEVSARAILSALGFEPGRDFTVANLDYGPSADALQNRRVAGVFLPGGVPTGAIAQAYATMGADNVALVEFTDEHLARLRARYPVWSRFIIPANTYPGQSEPVRVLAQPNVLATSTAVSEEVIELVTRTIWTKLDFLQRQHAATRSMKLERAFADMPLPLHPGAVRFYREAGVEVPPQLLPPEIKEDSR